MLAERVREFDMFSPPLRMARGAVSWAMSPSANQSRGLTGSSPGCAFTGKAGVICNGSASAAQQVITENDSCISFGKGGRYCPPSR
jgi:hypothetical protein